ncbi:MULTISPECIES: Na+/H+ antiporter subunit E [Micromonospora]|uniref:Na+/H+ antiporter subunit E n=1 Tax=Micromonospora TaxID=1873 RepID=UPI001EE9A257|nr:MULTISPECIES: Na+/H+ antiporter subunit E [Micromonospora]MCG5452505.1 Na+/H+ antiporter subunit E [Micromonospora hortensis]MCX5118137.1 Na+/H+ antiporter subunit E [Micromonospora sp. NBC_00362]
MTGSPEPTPDAPGPAVVGRGRLGRWRDQAVALGWLVLVWNLLWGDINWANLVGGLLVGAAVLVFFPLPEVSFGGRLRPLALLVFAGRFAVELVSASLHVARIAVQPGYRPRGAVISVRLRVSTDLNLALTAEAVSLVPGTLILEVDRDSGTLYLHVLDTHGPGDLDVARARTLAVERRIVRAVGSTSELRRLDVTSPEKGTLP